MQTSSPSKRVLTTGEVAKLCSVAPRTVSKWFDAGQLRGYRIPGSKDRRIPLDQLINFMRAHGIPLNGLASGAQRVVLLDDDRAFTGALRDALHNAGGYEVVVADSAFEAGALVREDRTEVLIVDVARPDVQTRELRRYLRATPELRELCVIGIGRSLSDHEGQSLLQAGFDGFLAKPFDIRTLIEMIETHTHEPDTQGAMSS